MLDYVLIVIAGMAMFLQAGLGLVVTTRPPSEKRRVWYEAAFVTVGAIGVVAIVWGGIRTARTSDAIQSGIKRVQSGQQTGFKTVITSLNSIGRPQEPKPVPPLAPVTAPSSGERALIIPESYVADEKQNSDGFHNTYLISKNKGQISAINPNTDWILGITIRKQTKQELDDAFQSLLSKMDKNATQGNHLEISPGDTIRLTQPMRLPEPVYAQLKSEGKFIYTMAVITYGDKNLRRGEHWLTEYCVLEKVNSGIPEYCPTHNLTRIQK
ncbi:MAG: hypothetical protein JWP28_2301 [Phenylobacterium sp.]|uniref:hypothetical protein n=1 Tax=Phenylobacterium sp. TaxID=1871053 RepID=UPI00262525CF|nr:hypothetical protein [Phenylobacterium sp.]MDB5498270.1 hypothetical protein [Phenylobacterium sp.]